MDHIQAQSQLKLHIKTSRSKLKFKLSKARQLSQHQLQTQIIPELRALNQIDDLKSRAFERGLDMLRMKLSQIIRGDRVADVWEDLDAEIAVLENSIPQLLNMMEDRILISKQIQYSNDKNGSMKSSEVNDNENKDKQPISLWSFLGFSFAKTNRKVPKIDVEPSRYKDSLPNPEESSKNSDNEGSSLNDSPELSSSEEPQPSKVVGTEDVCLDRITKVIRNILTAETFLGDDIKELKKLCVLLAKTVDTKELLNSPLLEFDEKDRSSLDLEDRVFVEILRKLKGVDEESIVTDYINELCEIYQLDLYKEGKYPENDDQTDGDSTENVNKDANGSATSAIPVKPTIKKQHDDLDDLKKRFEALKKL